MLATPQPGDNVIVSFIFNQKFRIKHKKTEQVTCYAHAQIELKPKINWNMDFMCIEIYDIIPTPFL